MAAKGGDSKQGLIITIVILVVFLLGLAVATYYGFADQGRLEAEKAKLKQEADSNKKDRDTEKFLQLAYKAWLGVTDKSDLENLGGLIGSYRENPEFKTVGDKLKATSPWNEQLNRPTPTLTDQVATLTTALDNARAERDKAKKTTDEALDHYRQDKEELEKALKQVRDSLSKAQPENGAIQQKKSQDYLDALDQIAKKDKEIEDLKKQVVQISDDADKEKRRMKKEITDLDVTRQKLQDKLPKTNLLDYD